MQVSAIHRVILSCGHVMSDQAACSSSVNQYNYIHVTVYMAGGLLQAGCIAHQNELNRCPLGFAQ